MKTRRRLGRRHPLQDLPNVVGIGYGLKIKTGRLTRQRCITVFVDRKRALHRLDEKDRVPPSAKFGNMELPTDVIAFGRFRPQSAVQIRAEEALGVVGCYGVRDGFVYAVSCAHVIGGKNGVVNQDEHVEAWNGNTWVPVGFAYLGLESKGAGVPGDWGMIDAGLVTCETQPQVSALSSFNDTADLTSLLGMPVIGYSAVSGKLRARVSHVLAQVGNPPTRVDVVITRDDLSGLTYDGDSGLLWTLEGGRALAIHVGGYRPDNNGMTTHAVGFFARRLERDLKLRLVTV